MALTMSGTTLTFNDATTQTTAAGGAAGYTAVGAYGGFWLTSSTRVIPNGTISGSYLYRVSSQTTIAGNHAFDNVATGANHVNATGSSYTWRSDYAMVVVNQAGTWRLVAANANRPPTTQVIYYGATTSTHYTGMYQRIS
jgi:hypothetical protein